MTRHSSNTTPIKQNPDLKNAPQDLHLDDMSVQKLPVHLSDKPDIINTIALPMEDYANTRKLLIAQQDEDKFAQLKSKFDKIMTTIKTPEKNKNDVNSIHQWSVNKHILCFLQNVLDETHVIKLVPWNDFKNQLSDFYDHRIQNHGEVTGAINTFYMNLDEYIMIYFLDKYKFRSDAELKILEMLASLKYYWDLWPRAKTFALLTNFITPILRDVNITKGNP